MHAGRALSEFVILRTVTLSVRGSRRGGERRGVGRIILYERLARVIEQGGRRAEVGARNWALLDVAALRVLVHVVSCAVGHWSDLFAFVCASATEEPDEKCNDDDSGNASDDASNDGASVRAAAGIASA